MATIQSDMRFALLYVASSLSSSSVVSPTSVIRSLGPNLIRSRAAMARRVLMTSFGLRAFSTGAGNDAVFKVGEKPAICTADELHYVSVPNSDWRLALWRYHPPPKVRNLHHTHRLLRCFV